MIITDPAKILRNFLSANLDELVRSGLSLRTTSNTETFNGNASDTTFTITRTDVLSIGEVSISSVVQTPYLDYNIDLDNHKIIFVNAPASGTDNVSVTYKYGEEDWVFESENSHVLKQEAYPFININAITESGDPIGASEDDTYDGVVFQIDVITFKDAMCTVEGEQKEGPNVKDYLTKKVRYQCLKNWRGQIDSKLFGPIKLSIAPANFDEGENNFRNIVEIRYNAFNIGE